ncbi:MAG TPA: efflux RND transporter permease subunit, partial [Planctomycetota bacterium]|nr:efflux RND transporter permease subunit [Planctomycetota bacterium]
TTNPSVELETPAIPPDAERFAGIEILHFFFVARETNVFMGAVAADPKDAGRLVELLKWAIQDIPGLIAVVQQASLFERGVQSGRSVDIEITGPELEQLVTVGQQIMGQVMAKFPPSRDQTPGHQARPIPSLDLDNPELHVLPDRERARDVGLSADAIGVTVDAVIDGAKASEVMYRGREIDLMVVASDPEREWRTQDFAEIPIATPDGRLVPLASVSDITVTRGPQQINHIERNRAITIQLVPKIGYPLEQAVGVIRQEIVEPLRDQGVVVPPYDIRLAGTVDDLYRAFQVFRWNFVLAIVITYLLMAALFDSFFYPFIVLFSVPLAAVGGVLCLDLVHAFAPQVQLDILTMLGFVILVGVVVNNAILIVYQTLDLLRAGSSRKDAILGAVETRLRPIFMTTATSVFGMLPLVVSPGAGSELYRGLGSVVLGGLVVSTVFTLVLIPALLVVFFRLRDWIGKATRTFSSTPSAGGEVGL